MERDFEKPRNDTECIENAKNAHYFKDDFNSLQMQSKNYPETPGVHRPLAQTKPRPQVTYSCTVSPGLKIGCLKDKVKALKKDYSSLKVTLHKYTQQVLVITEKFTKRVISRTTYQNEPVKSSSYSNWKDNKLDYYTQSLQSSCKKYKKKYEDTFRSLDEYQSENADLLSQNLRLQESLENAQELLCEKDNLLEEYYELYSKAYEESEQLSNENSDFAKTIHEKEAVIDYLRNELKKLEDSESLVKYSGESAGYLQLLKKKLYDRDKAIKSLKTNLENLTTQLENQKSYTEELENINRDLSEENSSMRKTVSNEEILQEIKQRATKQNDNIEEIDFKLQNFSEEVQEMFLEAFGEAFYELKFETDSILSVLEGTTTTALSPVKPDKLEIKDLQEEFGRLKEDFDLLYESHNYKQEELEGFKEELDFINTYFESQMSESESEDESYLEYNEEDFNEYSVQTYSSLQATEKDQGCFGKLNRCIKRFKSLAYQQRDELDKLQLQNSGLYSKITYLDSINRQLKKGYLELANNFAAKEDQLSLSRIESQDLVAKNNLIKEQYETLVAKLKQSESGQEKQSFMAKYKALEDKILEYEARKQGSEHVQQKPNSIKQILSESLKKGLQEESLSKALQSINNTQKVYQTEKELWENFAHQGFTEKLEEFYYKFTAENPESFTKARQITLVLFIFKKLTSKSCSMV